ILEYPVRGGDVQGGVLRRAVVVVDGYGRLVGDVERYVSLGKDDAVVGGRVIVSVRASPLGGRDEGERTIAVEAECAMRGTAGLHRPQPAALVIGENAWSRDVLRAIMNHAVGVGECRGRHQTSLQVLQRGQGAVAVGGTKTAQSEP